MELSIPELSTNMIVVTPNDSIENITPYKKYVIINIYRNMVLLRNDEGSEIYYHSVNFIEVDIFFALSLYMTLTRMFNLSANPLKRI